MSPDNDTAPSAAPPAVPWISTQHEMETSARPARTRLVRIRVRSGVWRIATVTYLQAAIQDASGGTREHLYRVALDWLAEYDLRDGKSQKVSTRLSANRTSNTLQFRVLETSRPDGTRVTAAKLGPKGQIAAEPRNAGLMSFLRAALVEWVVERHPGAVVLAGSLAQPDVQSPEDMLLRDQFFGRSGFTVQSTSDGGGRFFASSLHDLKTTWNTEKVVEVTPDAMAEALCAQLDAAALRKQVGGLESVIEALKKEKRATDVTTRIWIAITIVSVVFGIVLAIQPRVA